MRAEIFRDRHTAGLWWDVSHTAAAMLPPLATGVSLYTLGRRPRSQWERRTQKVLILLARPDVAVKSLPLLCPVLFSHQISSRPFLASSRTPRNVVKITFILDRRGLCLIAETGRTGDGWYVDPYASCCRVCCSVTNWHRSCVFAVFAQHMCMIVQI